MTIALIVINILMAIFGQPQLQKYFIVCGAFNLVGLLIQQQVHITMTREENDEEAKKVKVKDLYPGD